MPLLDGLNDAFRNDLLDNERDFRTAMEADFDAALETATEKHLSDADIAAILGGDDDLPGDELDVDDPDDDTDDVDADFATTVKPATESDIDMLLESLEDPSSIGDDDDEDFDDFDDDDEEDDDIDDDSSAEDLIEECDCALDSCGSSCSSDDDDDYLDDADEAETELDDNLNKVLDIPEFDDDDIDSAQETTDEEEDDTDGVSFEALLNQCLDNA